MLGLYSGFVFIHFLFVILLKNNWIKAKNDGTSVRIELKEGGSDIEVNDDNKLEYLDALLRYYMLDSIQEQVLEIIEGLHDVIPELLLAPFDYQELEILICGSLINFSSFPFIFTILLIL